jgi:hypothetical protein
VALRACTVSFRGPSGIRHTVEVTASSLYEAAALGIAALRKDGWTEALSPGTSIEIQVREPDISTDSRFSSSIDGATASRSALTKR